MDIGALSLLISEKGFDSTMAKVAAIDAAAARVGAKTAELKVTSPTALAVQAALARVGATASAIAGTPATVRLTLSGAREALGALGAVGEEKALVGTPVVIPVSTPGAAGATTALTALAEAEALQQTRVSALTAALAQAGAATTATAEKATILRAALDQDNASTAQLSAATNTLSIADRDGTAVMRLRTQALNELTAAQDAANRAANQGTTRVRAVPLTGGAVSPIAVGPQLGPATPQAEAFAKGVVAFKAETAAMALAAERARAELEAYEEAARRAGNTTQALSPKLRSAANGLTTVAFAATAMATSGHASFQTIALGAGLAASSIASLATGSLALWASGIGAAVVVGVAFIGILDRMAGSANATSEALKHVGNIDRVSSAQVAFKRASGEVERLTDKLGEMDEKVKDAASNASALGLGLLARALLERLKVQRELARAQEVLGATQVRSAEVAREEAKATAAAQKDAAVSGSRDQLTIATALIDRQESLNAQGYALGLINLDNYFNARAEIAERRSKATIAALVAERKEIAKAPVGEKPDEAIGRKARVASITAEIEAETTKRRTASQSFMAEREAAERALAQRIAGFEQKRMEAQGQTHEVRMQQIDQEVKEFERALAAQPGDPTAKAAQVTALRNALILQENFNEAQRQSGRIFAEMAAEREAIQRRVDAGQLTEFQGEQQIAAEERARIPALTKIADQMLAFGVALTNPDLIAAAKRLRGEIEAIGRTPLTGLAQRVKSALDELSVEAGAGDQWAASILKELQAAIDKNGGVVTVGIAVQAEWALQIKHQIEEQFALLEILLKPKNIVLSGVAEALGQLNQQLGGLATNVGNSIGSALAAGFSAVFTKGSEKNFAEAFGNTLLQSVGGSLVQLGATMLTYGLLMAAFAPLLLMSPFAAVALSAPAAIAVGTGLIALGAGLGAIAGNNTGTRTGGGGGGGSRGVSGAPAVGGRGSYLTPADYEEGKRRQEAARGPTRVVLDPDRRLREAREIAPKPTVNAAAKAAAPIAPFNPTFVMIGGGDPKVQRDIADIVNAAYRRNLLKIP